MARKRHPGKEIEMALRYAESYGWRRGPEAIMPVATRELARVTRQHNLHGSLQRYGLHA
ncbi:hypothetical protein [Pantoea sp. GD03673]|uniref:hypothetical protein n=1 Tax=Pantoea sp. GD03673 TaxID=2975364 RepID=UPI00244A3467|nr:hypothetical protein [Pantoea sp. GD03673]MDH2066669.1 hypothetical protein [Pantoea sp. GD03673]